MSQHKANRRRKVVRVIETDNSPIGCQLTLEKMIAHHKALNSQFKDDPSTLTSDQPNSKSELPEQDQ